MSDMTDNGLDEILGSAAPRMTDAAAARLRSSVLSEVRVVARPIRQRWFARMTALAVAATTVLGGASYAVAAAQPGEPLYPARALVTQVSAAVATTVTRILHVAPTLPSGGSNATHTPAPATSSRPASGTPMPGASGPQGPGTGLGSGPHGGMSATGSVPPSGNKGGAAHGAGSGKAKGSGKGAGASRRSTMHRGKPAAKDSNSEDHSGDTGGSGEKPNSGAMGGGPASDTPSHGGMPTN